LGFSCGGEEARRLLGFLPGEWQGMATEKPRLEREWEAWEGAKLLLLVLVPAAISRGWQPGLQIEGAGAGPRGGQAAARARGGGFGGHARARPAVLGYGVPGVCRVKGKRTVGGVRLCSL
jgi:hypothetical protein